MGLDTTLYEKYDAQTNEYTHEISSWRKCWGVDRWLRSKAFEVIRSDHAFKIDTEILKPIIVKMVPYIDKMISLANRKKYFVLDAESLLYLVGRLYDDENNDYLAFDKIIKSFCCEGLCYSDFQDSFWSGVITFINTYIGFSKATVYPILILNSSY